MQTFSILTFAKRPISADVWRSCYSFRVLVQALVFSMCSKWSVLRISFLVLPACLDPAGLPNILVFLAGNFFIAFTGISTAACFGFVFRKCTSRRTLLSSGVAFLVADVPGIIIT